MKSPSNLKIPLYKRLWSYVLPITLHRRESAQNGILEVQLASGKLVLNSQNANYSFDSLHRVFREVLSHIFNQEPRISGEILVLGLGAGSIMHILREEMGIEIPVTGIESDPEVLDIGYRFFGLKDYPNLDIQEGFVEEFLPNDPRQFGLILVDLFRDTEIPDFLWDDSFAKALEKHLLPEGRMAINTMLNEQDAKALLRNYESAGNLKGYTLRASEGNEVLMLFKKAVDS